METYYWDAPIYRRGTLMFYTAGHYTAESDSEALAKWKPEILTNVVEVVYRVDDNDKVTFIHQQQMTKEKDPDSTLDKNG